MNSEMKQQGISRQICRCIAGILSTFASILPSVVQSGMTNVFSDIRYVYNNIGDVIAVRRYTNEISYVERTYEYDTFGRKTKETDEVGNTLSISYDAVGNIVDAFSYLYDAASRPIRSNGDTFTYNARNEIVKATVGTNRIEHAYDDVGNQLVHAVNTETNRFESNSLNQLTEIESSSSSPWGFFNVPSSDDGLFVDDYEGQF